MDSIFEVVDWGNKDKIPKGLVFFEQLFDRHSMYKQKVESPTPKEYEEVSVGLESGLKIVKIGKGRSKAVRQEIKALIREYKDIFAWPYKNNLGHK